jgi:hypothetical protein
VLFDVAGFIFSIDDYRHDLASFEYLSG